MHTTGLTRSKRETAARATKRHGQTPSVPPHTVSSAGARMPCRPTRIPPSTRMLPSRARAFSKNTGVSKAGLSKIGVRATMYLCTETGQTRLFDPLGGTRTIHRTMRKSNPAAVLYKASVPQSGFDCVPPLPMLIQNSQGRSNADRTFPDSHPTQD